MLGDLNSPEAVERERRSVTMLSTGAPTYNREEALVLLAALLAALGRGGTAGSWPPRGVGNFPSGCLLHAAMVRAGPWTAYGL